MTFLAPWWLALLPLWPLLLLLMTTRDLARVRPAPDFLLWQRAAARLPAPTARARLSRKDALWLVPIVLLNLGLAQPRSEEPAQPAPVLVIVDRSASMATRAADGTTRLDRGLAEARRILGSRPHRIEGLPPGPAGEAAKAAVSVAAIGESAIVAHAGGIPVVVVTDEAPPGLPPEVGFVVVADGARNAGITAAGFDPATGLLLRVDADAGAGARTLTVVDGDGAVIESRRIDDPSGARIVLPPATVGSARSLRVQLAPGDALPLDDEVVLTRTVRSLRAALVTEAPAVERALRACPGVEVVAGSDPAADLHVGGVPARSDGFALLLPPVEDRLGFQTGAPAPAAGALSGTGVFDGLAGPPRWASIFPLARAPQGTEQLLRVGGAPLLVRGGNAFILLADPEENGWASLPSFPLTIARIVEIVAAAGRLRLEPADPVVPPAEARVARVEPGSSQPPAAGGTASRGVPLSPWLYAAALAFMAGLLLAGLTSRRGGATTRTPPASVPAEAIHRTPRS